MQVNNINHPLPTDPIISARQLGEIHYKFYYYNYTSQEKYTTTLTTTTTKAGRDTIQLLLI